MKWLSFLLMALVTATGLVVAASTSEAVQTAVWTQPDMDVWFYSEGSGGSRTRGPTFADFVLDSGSGTFEQQTSTKPARYGSSLFAFETSGEISPLLAPERYSVQAVTMTAMVEGGSSASESLLYEPNAKSAQQHLDEHIAGSATGQQPMELFGVGFQDEIDGFALGANQQGDRFSETSPTYPTSLGAYAAYPVVSDGNGGYRDVSNSVTGGYSATEQGNLTSPFDATPWAIGTTSVGGNELLAGDVIPNYSTFTFELNLNDPSILQYVQQSLAEGVLGFFLSSPHKAEEPGTGGTSAYPQWLMKESVTGDFPITGAEMATLSIEFSILEERIAGDYNGNGYVDQADYVEWKTQFGGLVPEAGDEADGNGNGVVDLADYVVWRNNLGNGTPPSLATVGNYAVPEPSGNQLVGSLVLLATFIGWVHWFVRPIRPERSK